MERKQKNPLVYFGSILGIGSGLSSIVLLLLFPQENFWLVLTFTTIILFGMVKLTKYLVGD